MARGDEGGGVAAGEPAYVRAVKANRKGNRRGMVGGVAGSVRYSKAMVRRICERIESGESLRTICADVGMPNRSSVRAWAARTPKVAADLDRARAAAGWHGLGGRQPVWCEQTAADICTRLAAGETMEQICEDPTMPSRTLVYYWRTRHPAFGEAVMLARQVQAERFCDLGWEIASAVTPGDAYATHVKLTHLRWTAGALAPARFGRFKAVTQADEAEAELAAPPAAPAETRVTFCVRHFRKEIGPDGTPKVVAYLRNSHTGELEREHPEPGQAAGPVVDDDPGAWLPS
ncbi:MAG: hypothetical protein KKB47_14710 [Alphaproteobacteria bacterium]|nr:hypothetical protein [Alphaproteobacteria bacterium]MBU1515755.1 hypothetical protein [Alphaproteobacteria bacterium]MBU2097038.1 hypothetical protein [Alphaproteobacteria bacterium]MBU2308940.1 hypothetical protein [Alphaproteobacteria bacterium]MBU2364112.1 hypothetical protein [Alphaproteobacteria bacterium]